MVVGRRITFKNNDELEEFQKMAKEFGMTLSSFIRYSMRFTYENRNKFVQVLEDVNNKLDSLTSGIDSSKNISELDKIVEILCNSVSSYNVLKLKEKLIFLMNEDPCKWWSFSEIVDRLGLDKEYSLQREFRVLIEHDKEFKALVEKKVLNDGGNYTIYFRLRDEMIPIMSDENYIIVPED